MIKYLRRVRCFLCVVCLGTGLSLVGAAAGHGADDGRSHLGSIEFANSGAAQAQTAFLTGMKALHSFEFGAAGEAFREAQTVDADFALAYWGEALSYNFPLTDAAVARLRPRAREYTVWDRSVPGLGVRVRLPVGSIGTFSSCSDTAAKSILTTSQASTEPS